MIQVGRTMMQKTMKSGKETRGYVTYKDIPMVDGWANARRFYPRLYDLVELRMSDGSLSKGWRTESAWDGRKFKPGLRIISWKRLEEPE